MEDVLQVEELRRREAILHERLDAEWLSWQPGDATLNHPAELIGTLVREEQGHTAYGEKRIIVVRTIDGTEWSVWLLHEVLADELAKQRPNIGDQLAIRYLGLQAREGKSDLHRYRVAVFRDTQEIDWDVRPGERQEPQHAEAETPAMPPVTAGEAAETCQLCGFRDTHAAGCPNDDSIPF